MNSLQELIDALVVPSPDIISGGKEAAIRAPPATSRLMLTASEAVLGGRKYLHAISQTAFHTGQPESAKTVVEVPPCVPIGYKLVCEDGRVLTTAFSSSDKFTIRGNDVFTEKHIPTDLAQEGGRTSIETPDGNVDLVIPASTKTGTILTLRGAGIPVLLGTRGDLKISIVVSPATSGASPFSKIAAPKIPAAVTASWPGKSVGVVCALIVVITGIAYFSWSDLFGLRPPYPITTFQQPIAESVRAPRLNVRRGPGLTYAIVKSVGRGESLTAYGFSVANDGGAWHYVHIEDGTYGYVNAKFMETIR